MRKLFNEFFYIPKYGKIREKVMLVRAVMTVTIVIMCLAAMSITAYAYFSYNVTSGSNTIRAANFEAQITVTSTNQNGEPVRVNPSSTDGKKTVFTFASPGIYTVKVEKGNSSTAKTGFCVINVGDKTYHTQQIGVDINTNNEERELVVFDLKINEPNIVATIESHWGTSSYYNFDIDESDVFYIINREPRKVIEIGAPVIGTNESNDEEETTTDETTAPTTETTQPTETSNSETTETTRPADPTVPETTETNEPTTTTEPSSTTELSAPANTTEPEATEPEETTENTETQPAEETTEAPNAYIPH